MLSVNRKGKIHAWQSKSCSQPPWWRLITMFFWGINDPSLIRTDTRLAAERCLNFKDGIVDFPCFDFVFACRCLNFSSPQCLLIRWREEQTQSSYIIGFLTTKLLIFIDFPSTLAFCVVICIDMTCFVCSFENCFVTHFSRNQITVLESRTWNNMLVLSGRN